LEFGCFNSERTLYKVIEIVSSIVISIIWREAAWVISSEADFSHFAVEVVAAVNTIGFEAEISWESIESVKAYITSELRVEVIAIDI
jgi:hypothetical protein